MLFLPLHYITDVTEELGNEKIKHSVVECFSCQDTWVCVMIQMFMGCERHRNIIISDVWSLFRKGIRIKL